MDLTIRDWMVIVGVLLIFAVLVDAWRRVRSERRATVKVNLAKPYENGSSRDEDLAWLKELPNGTYYLRIGNQYQKVIKH